MGDSFAGLKGGGGQGLRGCVEADDVPHGVGVERGLPAEGEAFVVGLGHRHAALRVLFVPGLGGRREAGGCEGEEEEEGCEGEEVVAGEHGDFGFFLSGWWVVVVVLGK